MIVREISKIDRVINDFRESEWLADIIKCVAFQDIGGFISAEKHNEIGYEMCKEDRLTSLSCLYHNSSEDIEGVKYKNELTEYEKSIINIANYYEVTTGEHGNKITIDEYIEYIKKKFGKGSRVYKIHKGKESEYKKYEKYVMYLIKNGNIHYKEFLKREGN